MLPAILGGKILGMKGPKEAPYIWAGIVLIWIGTIVWIYGDKLQGAL